VHFKRNAKGKVAKKHRTALENDVKAIYAAPSKAWAFDVARVVVERRKASHPAVARWIEDGIEDTLAYFAFPGPHRRRIWSTNGLERFNQEIKRRTRVVRIFPNREACLRLVTALCVEGSEEWRSGKRYLDMSHLEPSEDAAQGGIPATEDEEGDMTA
jgi:putative transposase